VGRGAWLNLPDCAVSGYQPSYAAGRAISKSSGHVQRASTALGDATPTASLLSFAAVGDATCPLGNLGDLAVKGVSSGATLSAVLPNAEVVEECDAADDAHDGDE
jgi:hypothetical protein